jgi:DNA-binding transcriptional ArsR family regulator
MGRRGECAIATKLDVQKYFYKSRIMESSLAVEALSALAQSSRLAAFRFLVRAGAEGAPAGAVADAVGAPANTMSSHLAILERAGLVSAAREGRVIRYRADYEAVRDLIAFLIEDCCDGRPEVCAPIADVARKAASCCG